MLRIKLINLYKIKASPNQSQVLSSPMITQAKINSIKISIRITTKESRDVVHE